MAKYVKTEQGYVDASIFAPAQFKPEGKSYLTFSSPNNFTLEVNNRTKNWNGTLEYFSSDKTWTTWDGSTILSAYNNDGEYVLYLRGTGNKEITGFTNGQKCKWVLTGSEIACTGNIENLLDYGIVESGGHPTMASYCYRNMFYGCTALTQAPALPATTLADYCYSSMFSGCSSLTQAPDLPATTLADYCYEFMFYGCTSLTKAPALPATTLVYYCYSSMFSGCTSLTQAPELPATTLANWCYEFMFSGCTSLTKAPALPAKTLAISCYRNMFYGCTSLTQAPELPATSLVEQCYDQMFYGCRSIKLSSTQTGEYTQEYIVGYTSNYAYLMFYGTGGTFTGTPVKDTYYLSTDNMIVRDTEVATLNGYVGSMIDNSVSNPLNITGATVGQIAKITAVDESGKPTSWEAVDGATQPDWNQNDSTQPDYVKNRPFYTGNPVETVLVEESTVQFTDIGGLYMGGIESTFSPTVGNAYKVYWDGTDYESVCVEVRQDKRIGNLSIDGSGPDTGEPFLMVVRNQEINVATLNSAYYHTISISRFVPGVVKIDEKYLPDTVATKSEVEAAQTAAENAQTTANAARNTADAAISLGLTSATPGQIIKVKTVQDGKPTEWETVDMPSGDKWEKIKEITIAEGAEESNALTINADENGNTFGLKKARLCAKFPAYTGTSTIPSYSFAMINGKVAGRVAPLLYTSVWPKISTNKITGTIYYVDVSGTQQIEYAQVSGNAGWSDDTSCDYTTYGSASDTLRNIYGDTLWAKPITSIGGTGMLIYPGCHFVLYGVRE